MWETPDGHKPWIKCNHFYGLQASSPNGRFMALGLTKPHYRQFTPLKTAVFTGPHPISLDKPNKSKSTTCGSPWKSWKRTANQEGYICPGMPRIRVAASVQLTSSSFAWVNPCSCWVEQTTQWLCLGLFAFQGCANKTHCNCLSLSSWLKLKWTRMFLLSYRPGNFNIIN